MQGRQSSCEGSQVFIVEVGLHGLVLQSDDRLLSSTTLLQFLELTFRIMCRNRGSNILLFLLGVYLVLSAKALTSLRFGSYFLFTSQL